MSVINSPSTHPSIRIRIRIRILRPAIKCVSLLRVHRKRNDLHNAEQYGRGWQLFLHGHNLMTTMSWHNNEIFRLVGATHVNFILLTLRISHKHVCLLTEGVLGWVGNRTFHYARFRFSFLIWFFGFFFVGICFGLSFVCVKSSVNVPRK